MHTEIFKFIRELYDPGQTGRFIPLHEPMIADKELKFVEDCIKSTFVSTVGEYVGQFERKISEFTGIPYAVATTNGTSALHLSLVAAGVGRDDLVLTQALSFVATPNAISYCGAEPVFIDSAKDNLGLCPETLKDFLSQETFINSNGDCIHKKTSKKIKACVPMHTFGHAVHIEEIFKICEQYNITLIEDAAEALGSFYKKKHLGAHGKMSVLSFNGNKIITSGGGGMVLTSNEDLAKRLKHLSTTAKIPHPWEFIHDEVGYNYRMPNLNAAFACAQMENLNYFIENKRETALIYKKFFENFDIEFVVEPEGAQSNYWLNAILLKNSSEKEEFLQISNQNKIMTRPVWTLLPELAMYKKCISTSLENAKNYANRIINIPSSVRR